MTREEAISRWVIPAIKNTWNEKRCKEILEALEQESVLDKVLDKIKEEIKNWYWQSDKQALATDPCVVDAMIDLFIRTINKYQKGSED